MVWWETWSQLRSLACLAWRVSHNRWHGVGSFFVVNFLTKRSVCPLPACVKKRLVTFHPLLKVRSVSLHTFLPAGADVDTQTTVVFARLCPQ